MFASDKTVSFSMGQIVAIAVIAVVAVMLFDVASWIIGVVFSVKFLLFAAGILIGRWSRGEIQFRSRDSAEAEIIQGARTYGRASRNGAKR